MSDHDIHSLYCDLDSMFEKIVNQDRENVANLRSAFQMMADMGYSADEAKEEFTRFQDEYNADRTHYQGQSLIRRQRVNRPTCEPFINAWGLGLWPGAWIPFWMKLQWYFWGLLALTYLYAWWKLAHGPRYWILKYGIGG